MTKIKAVNMNLGSIFWAVSGTQTPIRYKERLKPNSIGKVVRARSVKETRFIAESNEDLGGHVMCKLVR